jgi:hypothetical protein
MKIHVKKIWYGDKTYGTAKITLRDYWIKKAIRNKEDIIVEYMDRSMKLTPRKLKNPIGKRPVKSKIGLSDYELWDYYWKPKEEDENN